MNHDIDKILRKLDQQAADEVELLRELGPSYFSAEDLLLLKGRCLERQRLLRRYGKANMILGASSPLLLLFAIIFGLSGEVETAAALIKAFPLAFALFLGVAWLLKVEFDSTGQLELLIDQIEEELSRRQAQEMEF